MPNQLISLEEIDVDPNGSIKPCWILNRGIDNAARRGNAELRIELSLTFQSNGQSTTESFSIPITETQLVRDHDAKSVVIDTTLEPQSAVDQGATVTGTTSLVRATDPIEDAQSSGDLVSLHHVDLNPDGSIKPCWVLNRGIDSSSRTGNAAFRLAFTVIFTSNGQSATESFTIPISETTKVGDHDAKSVLVEATLQTQSPVDQASTFAGAVQLLHRNADTGADDPITDDVPFP